MRKYDGNLSTQSAARRSTTRDGNSTNEAEKADETAAQVRAALEVRVPLVDVGVSPHRPGIGGPYPVLIVDASARPDVAQVTRAEPHSDHLATNTAFALMLDPAYRDSSVIALCQIFAPVRCSFSIGFKLPRDLDIITGMCDCGGFLVLPEGEEDGMRFRIDPPLAAWLLDTITNHIADGSGGDALAIGRDQAVRLWGVNAAATLKSLESGAAR